MTKPTPREEFERAAQEAIEFVNPAAPRKFWRKVRANATILAAHDTAVAEAVREFADRVKTHATTETDNSIDAARIRYAVDAVLAGEDKGTEG